MIHQVLDSIDSAWMRLSQLPSRKVAAAVAALLLGTGATAFAVANLVPDASQVLVQQIVEPVQNLQSQPTESAGQPRSLLSADALADLRLYRSDITRSTDSADTVMLAMTDGRFRHMPVMEGDQMVGLISIGDVVKARLSELAMEKDALEGMIKGF